MAVKTRKHRKYGGNAKSPSRTPSRTRTYRKPTTALKINKSKLEEAITTPGVVSMITYMTQMPQPHHLLSEDEYGRYMDFVPLKHKTRFTNRGHTLIAILLKKLHVDKNIQAMMDMVNLVMKKQLTTDEETDIKNFIKLIFQGSRGRIEEMQSGGGISIISIFLYITFTLQLISIYMNTELLKQHVIYFTNDVRKMANEFNSLTKKITGDGLVEYYQTLTNHTPGDTNLYIYLNKVLPYFIEENVLRTEKFQNETKLMVTWINFMPIWGLESTKRLSGLLGQSIVDKKKARDDQLLRTELVEKIGSVKKFSSEKYDLFEDNEFLTVSKRKKIIKTIDSIGVKCENALLVVAQNTDLANDPILKDIVDEIDKLVEQVDRDQRTLEDALNNLSECREIVLVENAKTNTKNDHIKRAIDESLYGQFLKLNNAVNKFVDYQLKYAYDTFVAPVQETINAIEDFIKGTLTYFKETMDNIKGASDTLRYAYKNKDNYVEALQKLPNLFVLLKMLYMHLYIILPRIGYLFGNIIAIIIRMLRKIEDKKEDKSPSNPHPEKDPPPIERTSPTPPISPTERTPSKDFKFAITTGNPDPKERFYS